MNHKTSLQQFNFENSTIRTVLVNGEPFVVAKDVAEALDYTWNGNSRIDHVPAEWRGVTSVVTPSGAQDMACLTEHGLYFFLARSDKPKALPFQKWIAGEVIPSIRRSGMYSITNPNLPDFTNPAIAARAWADQFERADTAERLLDEAKPKIKFYEDVASSKTALPMELVAKVIGKMGRNTLFKLLREKGILRENNVPYQEYVDRGWFRVVETSFTKPTGEVAISVKTLVYQKGVEAITKIVEGVA